MATGSQILQLEVFEEAPVGFCYRFLLFVSVWSEEHSGSVSASVCGTWACAMADALQAKSDGEEESACAERVGSQVPAEVADESRVRPSFQYRLRVQYTVHG